MLSGGDRRSIGRANEAADLVLSSPELFVMLIEGISSADPVVAMRSADAAEKVTAIRPEMLEPFTDQLLNRLSGITQQEVRWHVAPMLIRLPLTPADEQTVMGILTSYTNDKSSIVRTSAMQAMADLALRSSGYHTEVLSKLEALVAIGTPAMRARGRKLLARLAGVAVTDR
jgi:hypothetical protein